MKARRLDIGVASEVTALTYQRDGARLFVGCSSGAIISLDPVTGKCDDAFQSLPPEPHFGDLIESRSSDGLFELRITNTEEEELNSRSAATRLALRELGTPIEVDLELQDEAKRPLEPKAALFSPTGRSLVVIGKTSNNDGTALLFGLPRHGKPLRKLRVDFPRYKNFGNTAFNEKGDMFAFVCDTKLTVWTEDGGRCAEIDLAKALVAPVIVWSCGQKTESGADSTTILLVSTDKEKNLRLVQAFSLVRSVQPPRKTRVTQTSGAETVDSESKPATHEQGRFELKPLSKPVTIGVPENGLFVPLADGRSGIVSKDALGAAMRVDLTRKHEIKATARDFRQAVGPPVVTLAQDATGGCLLAGFANGELRGLSIRNGEVAWEAYDWGPAAPGGLLCHGSRNDLLILREGVVRRLSYEPYPGSQGKLSATIVDRRFRVPEMLVSRDGLREVQRISEIRERYTAAAFAPDGRTRWFGLSSGGLRVESVDREDLTQKERIAAHMQPLSALAFAPDGQLLLSSAEDGSVRLWEVRPPNELRVSVPLHSQSSSRSAKSRETPPLGDFGADATLRMSDGELVFRWDNSAGQMT